MTTDKVALTLPTGLGAGPNPWLSWAPIALGLVALYGPSLYDLFNGIWSQSVFLHGPMVLAIALWLIYNKWSDMTQAIAAAPANQRSSAWGWPIVVFALLLYVVGRSMNILIFEMGSLIWLLLGLGLLHGGWAAIKVQWFALFFMLFMVPLPAPVVDTLTMPMKMFVSYMAEVVMATAGYPVGRSGVILQIGQYALLVADACAGLHTLLTLEAMGLLYLNLVRRDSIFRNLTIAVLIIPISLAANVIRVIALSLITFYWGDAAGQGFLHGFAGMVLFVSALVLIIGLDSGLHAIERWRKKV